MNQDKEMTLEEAAGKYAEEAVPNASPHNAQYYTTGDQYEDIRQSFIDGALWQHSQPVKPESEWVSVEDIKIKPGVLPVKVISTISGTITYGVGLFSNEGFEMATFLNKTTINNQKPNVKIYVLLTSLTR